MEVQVGIVFDRNVQLRLLYEKVYWYLEIGREAHIIQ